MQDDLQTLAGSDGAKVHAGFPDQTLIQVYGHSLAPLGINDGDTLVVDSALQAGSSDLLIAWRGGNTIICRQYQLETDDRPWGVIIASIHNYR
jgi:hypothetical protein